MRDGALMHTPASSLLRRSLLVSRRFATPSVCFFVVTWSQFRPSWGFPRVSAWPIFRFPAPVIFCLPSVGASTLELARFSTAPAFQLPWVPLSGGCNWLPQNVFVLLLWDLAPRNTAYSSSACLKASFTVFSPPLSNATFISWSSTSSANAFPASLLMWSSGRVG
jgi:hypothetical protein